MPEGTAMWLFHLFMKELVSPAISAWICLEPKKKHVQGEGTLKIYWKVDTYLQLTYAANDIVGKTDAEMIPSKQTPNMNPQSIASPYG